MMPKLIQAPPCAPGEPRNRPQGGQRPEWVRPFQRAERALDASVKLIVAALQTVDKSERCAHKRPIQVSRDLDGASSLLVTVAVILEKAARQLGVANECIGREPELCEGVPEMMIRATERWIFIAGWLNGVASEVFTLHEDVLHGLETGTLVPERPSDRRRRIPLAPRPTLIRTFLARRQRRMADRIAPILRRRRQTPRPAAVRVPKRGLRGRAPPSFSICTL